MKLQQKPNIFFILICLLGWILWILSSSPLYIALGVTERTPWAIIVNTIWNLAMIANFTVPVFNRDWTSFVFNMPIWLAQQIAMVLTIAVTFGLPLIFTIALCLISIVLLAVVQFSGWYMQRYGFTAFNVWWNWEKNSSAKTAAPT